jgi:hypothetical protein
MTSRSRSIGSGISGIAALFLSGCSLSVEGLGPDSVVLDAGSPALYAPDGSVGAIAPADAMAGAPTDAGRVAIDGRSVANGSDASAASAEGGSCVLPSRATLCCGSVACTDGDGTCATAGICALCQSTCTNPKKPICCASSSTAVTCAATPDGC